MTPPRGNPRSVILVSDRQLGSYTVVGDLMETTLRRMGVGVESVPVPTTRAQAARLASMTVGRTVIQNTIGPRFVPFDGARNIALVHHEWDRYPSAWVECLNGFDSIWVTTGFVGRTLRRSGVARPIRLVRPALDTEVIPRKSSYRLVRPIRFLSCGEWHFRKGFHLLVAAFQRAFPAPGLATLTIKTSDTGDWNPPRGDIVLVTGPMTREAWLALYRRFDVYVTASLGEGLGLPVAEAVLAGVPVVANWWGGHQDLLRPGFFHRLPHAVVPQAFSSRPDFFAEGQQCALSGVDDLARVLRRAASASAEERRRLASGARRFLLGRYAARAVTGAMADRWDEIAGDGPRTA